MPAAKPVRQTTPFTALLRDIQNRILHLKIAQPYFATLHWQSTLDPLALRSRQLHQ
jgi:hypothetical protein